jgi:two-component system sensor histidine kinase AlgZ
MWLNRAGGTGGEAAPTVVAMSRLTKVPRTIVSNLSRIAARTPEGRVSIPDFRNLGVLLRLFVLAGLAKIAVLVVHTPVELQDLSVLLDTGPRFEVSVLCAALILFLVAPRLSALSYAAAVWSVVGVAVLVGAGVELLVSHAIGLHELSNPFKSAVIAAMLAGLILAYFNWRQRILSPALAESRLMALQARIRPHFLFNSINTAISVVRDDPKRAEDVLLDMSELFRVVLAEPRALVSLGDELRVARAYLDIEQVRLGERLQVHWECEGAPLGAQVPVLLLQPLIENAVWHGIEPAPEGGEITVRISCRNKILQIEVSNPVVAAARSRPGGNRIALDNIVERLALHFDAEAQLRVIEKEGHFRVRVRLPLTFERQRSGARR